MTYSKFNKNNQPLNLIQQSICKNIFAVKNFPF